jgi:hypothetical protein
MVMPTFCVRKLYYLGNYRGIAVNYHGISVTNYINHNLTQNGSKTLQFGSKLPLQFNPRKSRAKITAVLFYNIGPRGLYYKTFYRSNCCRIVIS